MYMSSAGKIVQLRKGGYTKKRQQAHIFMIKNVLKGAPHEH